MPELLTGCVVRPGVKDNVQFMWVAAGLLHQERFESSLEGLHFPDMLVVAIREAFSNSKTPGLCVAVPSEEMAAILLHANVDKVNSRLWERGTIALMQVMAALFLSRVVEQPRLNSFLAQFNGLFLKRLNTRGDHCIVLDNDIVLFFLALACSRSAGDLECSLRTTLASLLANQEGYGQLISTFMLDGIGKMIGYESLTEDAAAVLCCKDQGLEAIKAQGKYSENYEILFLALASKLFPRTPIQVKYPVSHPCL